IENAYGPLTVTGCTVSGNTGFRGILAEGGLLTVSGCTITGNSGGGISCVAGTIKDSTIAGNSTYGDILHPGFGGGILAAGGPVAVIGCTISGNFSNYGGGICLTTNLNTSPYGNGTLTVSGSTLTGNVAVYGSGGGLYISRALGYLSNNSVTVADSI